MQDAYVVDQQKEGSWIDIGYSAPASNTFQYGSEGADWKATAQFSTDSPCDGVWTVDATVASGSSEATYNAQTKCTNLTPNFTKIGSSS